ncbi:MAG: hypothetical protein NZ480_04250 [Bdellovibrionaceae bacterium]|nr:hypothetical protein [Pseudobdellovibrionaceae bacterium]MDW8190184.1 hypothetical protein [Pseudobdellovibrionaceae bacterium]
MRKPMKSMLLFFVVLVVGGAWAGSSSVGGEERLSVERSVTREGSSTAKLDRLPEGVVEKPKEVVVGISDVFIPSGFDSTSEAYVVVSGVFPNGCYRWSRAEVERKGNNLHEVRSYAYVQPGMCLMVLVPFTKEVQLGVLESGTHRIRFVNGDGTYLERTLVVE